MFSKSTVNGRNKYFIKFLTDKLFQQINVNLVAVLYSGVLSFYFLKLIIEYDIKAGT